MKLWITRLSGDLITSAHYQPKMKKDSDDSSSADSRSEKHIDEKNQDEYGEIRLMDTIKNVINHSRSLSLSLYDHQLIYCRFQGTSFYYRAKYNLLFIVGQQSREYLDLTVDSIDSIILKTINIYQTACDNIRINYKIPRVISNYQTSCLQKISNYVVKLIADQTRKNSIHPQQQRKEQQVKQQEIAVVLKNRNEDIANIQGKLRKLQRMPSLFERNAIGSVHKYRLKLFFVMILVVVMIFTSIFLIFFSPNNERLIL